jgi:formate dehydrogenase subunit delta
MDTKKLVRMANQIAANLDYGQQDRTALIGSVADHLRRFWTPDMRREIVAEHREGKAELEEIAAKAVAKLGEELQQRDAASA